MSKNRTFGTQTAPGCPKTRSPNFGHLLYSECPNTGRPVWRTGHIYVRLSNRPDFGRPVHSKPSGFRMPNCIWAFDNRTFMSGYRTFGQLASSEIRTLSYEPDVRNPDDSITGHIYVRFSKPDVRFSDVYCIYMKQSSLN